jgi:hypothetical protein
MQQSPIAFLDGDRAMSGYGSRSLPYVRHRKEPSKVSIAPPVVTCHQAEADQISQERAVIGIICLAAGAAAEVAATTRRQVRALPIRRQASGKRLTLPPPSADRLVEFDSTATLLIMGTVPHFDGVLIFFAAVV